MCGACTTAKTLPTPTAMSRGTSPTPSTSITWSASATNDGVHLRVTSRTRSSSQRAIVSTGPASVSTRIRVSGPWRRTIPVSIATVAAPMVPSPQET